jgi:hypothetical protein
MAKRGVMLIGPNGVILSTHPTGRESTITVAASDSSPQSRIQADYVCDGIDDQVEIQAAIDAVVANGAGTVVLSGGTFNCAANIDFADVSGMTGRFIFDSRAAVLKASANLTQLINLAHSTDQILRRGEFLFGELDLNKATYTVTQGVYVRYFNDNHLFIGHIKDGSNDGIVFDQSGIPSHGTFNNFIEILAMSGMASNNFYVKDNQTTNYSFQGNIIKTGQITGGANGIIICDNANDRAHSNTFICGPIEHTSGYGIYDRAGGNIFIVNNTNNNTTKGIGCPAGVAHKSTFQGHFEDSYDNAISKEHFLTDSNAGTPEKSLWQFPVLASGPAGVTLTGNHSEYTLDAATEYVTFEFAVPSDFTTLVAVEIWGIKGGGAGTIDWTVTTDFGADSEAYNNHSDTATADGLSMSDAALEKVTISDAFTGLSAGDFVGVEFTLDAISIGEYRVIGLKFRYT